MKHNVADIALGELFPEHELVRCNASTLGEKTAREIAASLQGMRPEYCGARHHDNCDTFQSTCSPGRREGNTACCHKTNLIIHNALAVAHLFKLLGDSDDQCCTQQVQLAQEQLVSIDLNAASLYRIAHKPGSASGQQCEKVGWAQREHPTPRGVRSWTVNWQRIYSQPITEVQERLYHLLEKLL